jgi:hypothetical protein
MGLSVRCSSNTLPTHEGPHVKELLKTVAALPALPSGNLPARFLIRGRPTGHQASAAKYLARFSTGDAQAIRVCV